MSHRLIQTFTCVGISFYCLIPTLLAQSNSKGANSSVIVGILQEVNATETEFKVLQSGDILRTLHTDSKSKAYFVGFADKAARKATVGYAVKASCDKDGRIKTISFTPPISQTKPLGQERLSMTPAELFSRVDADKDDRVSYGEFSLSVYHSPKHGPDHFRKVDSNRDGGLDSKEFLNALEDVSWWTLSRKSAETWFQEADADRDNKLTIKEFAHICTSGNHVNNVFKRADRDKSGTLSPRESSAYIRSITHGKPKSRVRRR